MTDRPYYTFNREERNLAAILYHLLLSGEENLKRFLELVDHKPEWSVDKCEVYFEYAWLRDKWHLMDKEVNPNEVKRNWVEARLPPSIKPPSVDKGIRAWNEFFGLTKKPSSKHIQSPANWVLAGIHPSVQGNAFRKLAMLKWAFNIKPDLVIITGDNRAVCVEAKVESGAGKYPTSKSDKAVWKARLAGEYIDQLDCQRNLFERVLDYPVASPGSPNPSVRFVLLDNEGKGQAVVKGLSWSAVFTEMKTLNSHAMVKKSLEPIVKA
ncbi:MAG: hypothetical protein KDC00_14520 [Flavobacteriales bacterium]|nr:hypothetical protein [Flavobacteriales bacterium]